MDPAVTVTGHSTRIGSGRGGVRRRSRGRGRRAATLRQSRVEMSKIDLWSVLKVSLCFYLAGLALLIVTGLVVWLLARRVGRHPRLREVHGRHPERQGLPLRRAADPRSARCSSAWCSSR